MVEAAPALNILGLDETAISDAALPRLAKLSVATVRGTTVSAEACRRLQETSTLELLQGPPLSKDGDAPPDHENGAV